ncbi:two-component system, OmpR family, sensor kinase [Roseovarius marisflavi]|uniref:histidine kinase n=1 Tax=Roseovarius marisflavi TaxID=1054996 RepID=A0A1M7AV81_9RHOB|nr:ATP-binding protein [Roseovarius marisflavi]SHL46581.1 two-component system, OmpR family, sensor kinase [Roseovarius marisflavi]
MRLPGSLQGRLALGLGLGLAVLWLATAFATATLLRSEMNEVFDSALEETAQRILPLAVLDILDRDEEGVSQRIASLRQHEEYFTYIVRDDLGRVLLRSHSADIAVFPPYEDVGFSQTATHRLYFDAALRGTITIAIAEPLAHRAEVARESLMTLALPLFVVIPLSLIGLLLIVRRSLAPVRDFSGTLSSRGARDLSPVGADSLPDEFLPVSDAVNQLLDRLRRTLEAERSFTANAAHELRTPVAAALAQTQRLMAETKDATAGARAGEIETALKRLNRLSEKLMQLARAEGGRLRRETASDLRPVLCLALSAFERTAGADRIVAEMPDSPVLSDFDPDAFAIMVRNLVENALRHGTGEAPVRVRLTREGLFSVRNDGPALAPETLTRLTARFERGQNTSADGSGLGLSIVQAIADGAQARFSLHSPATGRPDGFEARFQVPLAQEDS